MSLGKRRGKDRRGGGVFGGFSLTSGGWESRRGSGFVCEERGRRFWLLNRAINS